jgi:uncharacterized protein (DUF1015 family)
VPEFDPFAGVRYDAGAAHAELDALAAPPYDVIDDDLHAALEAADERNSVRLILPRDESAADDRYARAAATFSQWCGEGVLVRDSTPRFYSYRMTFTDAHGRARHTHGVLGAMRLPEADDNSVLPHERTLPKAKSDRLSLLRAMRVNVDPIWGLTLASGLTSLLAGSTPLGTCRDHDGVVHELGAIDDPQQVEAIRALVGPAPLVLADGHHRFETAINYRNELRAAGDHVGGADAIMTFIVELVDDELCIEPIHRLIDVPTGVDLRARLEDAFELRDAGPIGHDGVEALENAMRRERALGLADARGLALAVPRHRTTDVDAGVVEDEIVPRLPEATWQYRHDAQAVAALVDKGSASAAILCSPVSVAQTRAVATARERMPQKTTFFWPKPRTGMVFRTLD